MRRVRLALSVGTALLLASAVTGAARDRRLPDAVPSGEQQSCIPLHSIRQSHVRSDHVIDFETVGSRLYRNTLAQGCPGLGFDESFSYATSLDRLCSGDIITVLQSPGAMRGASCSLGYFQPVTLVKKPRR